MRKDAKNANMQFIYFVKSNIQKYLVYQMCIEKGKMIVPMLLNKGESNFLVYLYEFINENVKMSEHESDIKLTCKYNLTNWLGLIYMHRSQCDNVIKHFDVFRRH